MFTNESTENLLDNLENELTEMIELEQPSTSKQTVADIEMQKPPEIEAPVPAKRSFNPSPSVHPIPAARRLQSRDKNEKNDENEIIQLSSISSDLMHSSASSSPHAKINISQASSLQSGKNTIIMVNEKKKQNSSILMVHEAEMPPDGRDDETFFVIKHGKWANGSNSLRNDQKIVVEQEPQSVQQKPPIEVVVENSKKKKPSNDDVISVSSTSQSNGGIAASSSSSSSESPEPVKRSKSKARKKKKSKHSESSDGRSAATGSTNEINIVKHAPATDRAIGIFIHSTGIIKYNNNLKNLSIKISIYNEDNGKMIFDAISTKAGKFNDDFCNLICTWNEMLTINQDLQRMQEIYNNILIFFEIINSCDDAICWAFLKLFSSKFINIDKKFVLQLFEYRNLKRKFFSLRRNVEKNNLTIYEQWQMRRRKFAGTLSVTVKNINHLKPSEPTKENVMDTIFASDDINRKWRKMPGQACKIPNKIFLKIPCPEKGSMVVKFSHDGNFLAYSEVSRDGFILHIQKFPEMMEAFTMLEHSDLIHDIDWLKVKNLIDGNHFLVTASSDFTAIVWKLEQSCYTYNILPHPSFVYASKFLQSDDLTKLTIVTAGRDSIVRLWRSKKKRQSFELIQELKPPNSNKTRYITSIATRNADTFYTSNSNGDVTEWTLRSNKEYHLNRHFVFGELQGRIVTSMELHPRGNKIYLRIQDFQDIDNSNIVFVLGVPTGLITQRHQQFGFRNEAPGKLRISPCGSYLFSTDGHGIRYHQLTNGNLASNNGERNQLNIKIAMGDKSFISSMDYNPKDFYFACAVYGANGGIIISNHEAEIDENNRMEAMTGNHEVIVKAHEMLPTGNFSDLIKRLDQVFLTPCAAVDVPLKPPTSEIINDDNTFTLDTKRSGTYTISQGPATFTVKKDQNNTYEVQRNVSDDDETTISESFN